MTGNGHPLDRQELYGILYASHPLPYRMGEDEIFDLADLVLAAQICKAERADRAWIAADLSEEGTVGYDFPTKNYDQAVERSQILGGKLYELLEVTEDE